MNIKLEKIVNYKRSYLGRDGKERPSTAYYLVITFNDTQEKRVCIKPAFGKERPSEFTILDLASNVVVIRDETPTVDKKETK